MLWRTKRLLGVCRAAEVTLVALTFSACGGGGGDSAAGGSPGPAAPTVMLTSNAASQPFGGSIVLSWSSTNSQACNATNGWTGAKSASGQETLTANNTATFVLTCSGAGGHGSAQVSVNVIAGVPVVSLVATPQDVAIGETSVLSWSATDSQTCVASIGWGGVRTVSGTWTTAAINSNTTYLLSCVGPGGNSTTSVVVRAWRPPVATLFVNPKEVETGGLTRVTWDSTNTADCEAAGAWTGSRTIEGSEVIGPIPAGTSEIRIVCRNGIGEASAFANVTAKSTVRLLSLELVELQQGHSVETYLPIQGEPLSGPGTVSALVAGPLKTLRAQLFDPTSKSMIVERELTLIDLEEIGMPGFRRFRGDVTVPNGFFRIAIIGELEDGSSFSQELPRQYRPQSFRLAFANGPGLTSNVSSPINVELTNTGTAAEFLVKCAGDRPLAITPVSQVVQIGASASAAAVFDVVANSPVAAADANPSVHCFALILNVPPGPNTHNKAAMQFEIEDVLTAEFSGTL